MAEGDLTLKVQRFDPTADKLPYWQSFTVKPRPGMTVLDALFEVLNHQDGTLSFRFCCRAGVCGSCAMVIGGKVRLACETQVAQFVGKGDLMLSPLPHQPVVKDLAVDYTHFFDRLKKVKPYLVGKEPYPEKEYIQSTKERQPINDPIDCILCGSCTSSCTMAWTNSDYLGPAALLKSYRFLADTRDSVPDERLDIIEGESGVWRCHTQFNCVEVCPKKLNPTEAIQKMKIKAFKRKLFGRRGTKK
ncbi:MAG TPA: succinate dehydrogenase iron-sulfur subunit [Thermoplasmata archaeon]|nr:succinate dehydrogenase iron-sulfur subunit [Thermoplasmata archaeon]